MGEGIVGEFGMDTHTLLYLIWIQQGHTIWCRELCSMLCGSLEGKGVGEMDMCICKAESLCCLAETITTLLIG